MSSFTWFKACIFNLPSWCIQFKSRCVIFRQYCATSFFPWFFLQLRGGVIWHGRPGGLSSHLAGQMEVVPVVPSWFHQSLVSKHWWPGWRFDATGGQRFSEQLQRVGGKFSHVQLTVSECWTQGLHNRYDLGPSTGLRWNNKKNGILQDGARKLTWSYAVIKQVTKLMLKLLQLMLGHVIT